MRPLVIGCSAPGFPVEEQERTTVGAYCDDFTLHPAVQIVPFGEVDAFGACVEPHDWRAKVDAARHGIEGVDVNPVVRPEVIHIHATLPRNRHKQVFVVSVDGWVIEQAAGIGVLQRGFCVREGVGNPCNVRQRACGCHSQILAVAWLVDVEQHLKELRVSGIRNVQIGGALPECEAPSLSAFGQRKASDFNVFMEVPQGD